MEAMIKKTILLILFICLIGILISLLINMYNNSPEVILEKINRQLTINQKIKSNIKKENFFYSDKFFTFDVIYMNILKTAIAKLSLEKTNLDKNVLVLLKAILEPTDFIKKNYDAKIVISSNVLGQTGLPFEYNEIVTIPDKVTYKKIIFDQYQHLAIRDGKKYKIPENTYEPLSVFFRFLAEDYVIDSEIKFNIFTKEDIYEFRATPIEIKNGIYKIKGEVGRQRERSTLHNVQFTIWVKNDTIRVPLLIRCVSSAGIVYLRLREIQ